MNRLAVAIIVCGCLCAASPASADDGGWWDWLWKFDTHFMGGSVDFHVFCLDTKQRAMYREGHDSPIFGCEEFFTNLFKSLTPGANIEHRFRVRENGEFIRLDAVEYPIKHEFDVRVGYARNFGDRYGPPDPPIGGAINIWKLMGLYRLRFSQWVAVEGGAGTLIFRGDRFDGFERAIYTAGLVFTPIREWKWFEVLPAFNYMPGGFSAADVGDPGFVFNHPTEKNISISAGIDVRHLGHFQ